MEQEGECECEGEGECEGEQMGDAWSAPHRVCECVSV